MNTLLSFFQKPIFRDKRLIAAIWFVLPIIAAFKHITRDVSNNFLIFKYSFYHLIDQVNLYAQYPEYGDSNHYGPFFGLLMTPFALLPYSAGIMLWELTIAATLFIAIYKMPVKWIAKVIIFWLCFHPLYSNAVNSQTNTLIAALIIGAFTLIRKEKDFWAACLIALGFFIKLYGIVGLAFFFFSRHKIKFSGYFVFWCIVFFTLPMLLSSPEFIVQSYVDWYESLVSKNMQNAHSVMQNISAIGMFQRIFSQDIPNMAIILPAILLFALQYIRTDLYSDVRYQFAILASVLMFIVLFSTGSESSTYIITTAGFAIWFITQDKPYRKYTLFLFIFTLLIMLMGLPSYTKRFIIRPYALNALPFLMVWLTLVFQVIKIKKQGKTYLSDVYLKEEKE